MSCCQCCSQNKQHKKTVIIKNPKSGLVLDATDLEVKIQPFNGSAAQLWTLECIGYGRFVIINRSNGKILNIQGGARSGANLITWPRTTGLVRDNEQWNINGDGTIMSPAAGKLVVDIFRVRYTAGTNVIAFPKHGRENQIFQLAYK